MDNQNGYNQVVPNNNQVPTPSVQPNYGMPVQRGQQVVGQVQPAQMVVQQPVYQQQPVPQVAQTQPAVQARPVSQPIVNQAQTVSKSVQVQAQPSVVPGVSAIQQTPVQASPVTPATSPSYAQQTIVPQSYPQQSQTVQQPTMSYPQASQVYAGQQASYPQVQQPAAPKTVSYPQQTIPAASQQQVTASPQVSYAQPSQQVTQTQPASAQPTEQSLTSVPTNPIIDLNPQAPVIPIEQTINQPNTTTSEQTIEAEIPSIFVPDPTLDAEFNGTEPEKKKKIKLPNLSKKQLILVAAVVGALLVVIIITTVIGKGSSSGNNPGGNNNSSINSNGNATDDSYKDLPIDDWLSYKFEINGKQLSLPISYDQLAATSGFTMKTQYKNQKIDKNNYMSINLYKNKKLSLYTEIYNASDNSIKIPSGNVTRISQTHEQVKKGADIVTFPANLKVGMEMTKESLINLIGKPSDIKNYSSNDYVNNSYIYYESNRTGVNYYEVKIVNDIIDQLTIDHRG